MYCHDVSKYCTSCTAHRCIVPLVAWCLVPGVVELTESTPDRRGRWVDERGVDERVDAPAVEVEYDGGLRREN